MRMDRATGEVERRLLPRSLPAALCLPNKSGYDARYFHRHYNATYTTNARRLRDNTNQNNQRIRQVCFYP
jgi:hypothetical protein